MVELVESKNLNLQMYTRKIVKQYLLNLKGHKAKNLHGFIIGEIEKGVILEVLEFTKGNLTQSADILGITRTTLRNKSRKHKI
jgi:Fis family transcriptional regulator